MQKIIIALAVVASLAACSNENFKAAGNFTVSQESLKYQNEDIKKNSELLEGANLKKYIGTLLSKGVYSICIEGQKNYLTKSDYDPNVQVALTPMETTVECQNEGEIKNVLNGLEDGLFIYCSQENIKYQIIHLGNAFSFYPMRNQKFQLLSCERKEATNPINNIPK